MKKTEAQMLVDVVEMIATNDYGNYIPDFKIVGWEFGKIGFDLFIMKKNSSKKWDCDIVDTITHYTCDSFEANIEKCLKILSEYIKED